MPEYTLQQIADAWNIGKRTVSARIAMLIEQKKFTKTGLGKFYNDTDVKKLSKLTGNEWPQKAI